MSISGPTQHKRGPWSQNEDAYLMSLIQTQGPLNWVRIAAMLGTRSPKQCRERYHQNLKPTLNHDPITAEEGVMIERLVRQHGKRWAEIARHLPGRSDNAVKNWWNGSQNRRKRLDKRKAGHLAYDERTGMATGLSPMVPRTISMPQNSLPHYMPPQHHHHQHTRPLPPPLPLLPSAMHYGMETPLSSPTYSPDSEAAPSLISDSGSHYGTSPRYYDSRPLQDYGSPTSPQHHKPRPCRQELSLPPLKMTHDGGMYSPQSSVSPTDNKLPSLKDQDNPIHPYLSAQSTSPRFSPVVPVQQFPQQESPRSQHQPCEYFPSTQPWRTQLPTAPSSPSASMPPIQNLQLNEQLNEERTRDERGGARMSVHKLLQ
ncbi:putative Myb-like DNA-binding protein [Podospora australis]|uniref:Myb-like DNA-binding protein n=1 Tax=Podospora australis TaxID=1536484 RepID=A0AAN6X5B6_9PEZI|nr:putative Myb-like DNA-binding protein [Podospora australis]